LSGPRIAKRRNGFETQKVTSDLRKCTVIRRFETPWNARDSTHQNVLHTKEIHAMKYTPSDCPKCGSALVKSPKGGRPTRWCSEGCKRSGESEMARLESLLRVFSEGKYVEQLNGRADQRRDEVLANMQKRYDKLAGVPVRP
jgi:hypothetical protein